MNEQIHTEVRNPINGHMYTCVCVCMYVRRLFYAHTHTYVYTYTHTCIHVCSYGYPLIHASVVRDAELKVCFCRTHLVSTGAYGCLIGSLRALFQLFQEVHDGQTYEFKGFTWVCKGSKGLIGRLKGVDSKVEHRVFLELLVLGVFKMNFQIGLRGFEYLGFSRQGLLFWLFKGGFKVSSGTVVVLTLIYHLLYAIFHTPYTVYYIRCTDLDISEVASPVQMQGLWVDPGTPGSRIQVSSLE